MRCSMLLLLVALGLWLLQAEAVTREDFQMLTTQDLVDVCSVKPGEANYEGALGFCYGFEEGSFQYYMTLAAGSPEDAFICPPQPTPSRADVMQWFLAWARDNPRYLNERPVDGLFRFLQATWPCRQ
jgi:Rap1a immunity proteins